MNEKTRKRLVFGILVAAILFGLVMKPWDPPRKRIRNQTSDTAPTQATPAGSPIATATPKTENMQQYTYATAWPVDPFTPVAIKIKASHQTVSIPDEPKQPGLTLQGIITENNKRVCVVNGIIYAPGSRIKNWKVKQIGPREVLLVWASDTLRLELP